jgi:hypothetical protein
MIDNAATVLGFEFRESWVAEEMLDGLVGVHSSISNSAEVFRRDEFSARIENTTVGEQPRRTQRNSERSIYYDSASSSFRSLLEPDSLSSPPDIPRRMAPRVDPTSLKFIEDHRYHIESRFCAFLGATPVDGWFRSVTSETRCDVEQGTSSKAARPLVSESLIEELVLVKCRHPSILHLIGTIITGEGSTLVTERTAFSLAYLLGKETLSLSSAVRTMHQISSALSYMHDRGICHRAIEAESVLFLRGGVVLDPVVKLSNFSKCLIDGSYCGHDIADFAELLCLVSGSTDRVEEWNPTRMSNAKISAPPPLNGLKASCPALANLIKVAWNGGLSAYDVAMRLRLIDAAVSIGSVRISL